MNAKKELGGKQKSDQSGSFINSDFIKNIQKTAEAFQKYTVGINKIERLVPPIPIPINHSMLDFIGKFSYIGSRLIFEKSYLSILNLVEELDEIEKSDFEYKWLGEMPYSDLKELYNIHKTKGKDAVNSYFLHFFKQEENISKLIEFLQTDQYFAPRIHILQDALYAHLNSKYTLSIPVLYSQIDGIVVDVAVAGGIKRIEIKDKTNSKKPKIVFQTSDGSRVRNYDFANVIDEYNEIKGFFFDKLAKYLKDDLYFERNDILHGRKIDYNTETNSMRLILILLELKGNYEIV